MDLILRNALIAGEEGKPPVDIGIEDGRIAAIEAGLAAEGEQVDVDGRLVSPGFIETHIHLDKSCLLDRCKSVEGTLEEAIS
ncbi:MAG: amidohydrolase, partial [Gammaproteobacteria bacterium]|nr:amidohydrolase [Gammaproteobacteria bacterium]